MRAVLDTNVVFGAARRSFLYRMPAPARTAQTPWKGMSQELLDRAKRGDFIFISSPDLMREFEHVMARVVSKEIKRATPRVTREELRADLFEKEGPAKEGYMNDYQLAGSVARMLKNELRRIPEQHPTDNVPLVCKDPDDDYVLAAAGTGRAEYIVTYDRHLLDMDYGRMVRRHRRLSDTYSFLLGRYNERVLRDEKQLRKRKDVVDTLSRQLQNGIDAGIDEEGFSTIARRHAIATQRYEGLQKKRESEWAQQYSRLEERRRNLVGHRKQMKDVKHSQAYRLYGHIRILPPFEFMRILQAQAVRDQGNDQQQVA